MRSIALSRKALLAISLRSDDAACASVRGAIEERSKALGVRVRVADADVDVETRERMRASFERGDLRTWGYGDAYADAAADPLRILARARSVLCVAIPYARLAPTRVAPGSGLVSKYAWSRDYHVRVRAILNDLAAHIDAAADGSVTAIACDTAPVAERARAARSGLAWIGKHTNAIAPDLGSYVFLGEIFCSLELPADKPLKKQCGNCTRCVDICPTGALRGDYTIDATRCIADLTQRVDAIPRALRPLLGDWVWGCDLCQDICPPTARAGACGDAAFDPFDDALARPDLQRLLALRSGEYKRRYRPTAMGWRGAAVLRRNAAVGLGNALDRAAIPALARALEEDPHPLVRGAAAWALGRIGGPAGQRALVRARELERDAAVVEEIEAASKSAAWRVEGSD